MRKELYWSIKVWKYVVTHIFLDTFQRLVNIGWKKYNKDRSRMAVMLKSVWKRNKFTCSKRQACDDTIVECLNHGIASDKVDEAECTSGLSRDVVFTSHIRRSALTGTNVPDVPVRKPLRRFPVRRRVYASASHCACQYQYFKPNHVPKTYNLRTSWVKRTEVHSAQPLALILALACSLVCQSI